jgi:tetratricopeptide (TPR) repeat protein
MRVTKARGELTATSASDTVSNVSGPKPHTSAPSLSKGPALNTRHGLPAAALLIVLMLATTLAYQPAWSGEPLWDDDGHLTKAELRPIAGLRRIWTEIGATQQYYPLTHSAFWLQHRLWGDRTTGYHLANIVLHAGSAFLFVLLLRRLNVAGAELAGMVFALHPIHVESVAWISELKNVLSGVFFVAAALAYVRFDECRARRVYLAALLLFVLALLGKSVTATLPGALLVLCWWRHGIEWRRDVVPLVPFIALGAVAGLTTVWVEHSLIGARGLEFDLSATDRVLVAGRAIWFYLGKLLWPWPLVFNYPRWQIDGSDWWQSLYPLAIAAVAAVLWVVRHRGRGPLAALLIFCGTLFPVLGFLNVYPFRYAYVADHFVYHASLPVIAFASAAIVIFLRRTPRVISRLAQTGLVVLLGVLTWQESHSYTNVETLYLHTIERNPSSWLAHHNLGMLKLAASPVEASEHLRAAARIRPADAQTRVNLGYALQLQGRYDEALAEYREAIRADPAFAEAHNNLCSVLHQMNRAADAIAACRDAIRLSPTYAKAHFNMGLALARAGQRGSLEHFREAVRLDAGAFDLHALAILLNDLGVRLQFAGSPDDAIAYFTESVRLDGSYANARFNLANALQRAGRSEASLPHYEAVLQQDPRDAAARVNYGVALERSGRIEEAVRQYTLALQIAPDSAEARNNLNRLINRRSR